MSAAAAAVASVSGVSSRLRVVHRSFLVRRGRGSNAARYHPAAAVSVVDTSVQDVATHPRYIDAEDIHSDLGMSMGDHAFWGDRRWFYRKPVQYYPTWDRQAQALAKMCRQVPRVPQEAAFRLFAVFLKLLLLPQLMTTQALLLPSQVLMNVEGTMGEALKKDGEESKAGKPADANAPAEDSNDSKKKE